jgi:hypothetical protein
MHRTDWTGCNLEPKKPPKYRKKRTEKTINTGWTQSKTKNLILSFLLSRWLRVRISPRSQVNALWACLFFWRARMGKIFKTPYSVCRHMCEKDFIDFPTNKSALGIRRQATP